MKQFKRPVPVVEQMLEQPSGILTIKGKSRAALQRTGLKSGRRLQVRSPLRRLNINAAMFVLDYENFGSDETWQGQQQNVAYLSAQGVPQQVFAFEVRMGGEIRVEFNITAFIWDQFGNIMANWECKLFEGTSESTGDLDGVRQGQLYCPVNAPAQHNFRIDNDDEGDDYANISFTIANNNP